MSLTPPGNPPLFYYYFIENIMSHSQTKQALLKIADLLSLRSHSRKELKNKLSGRFSPAEIEEALEKAEKNHWLQSPEELSQKTTHKLNAKNKSHTYIKAYLNKKGLPTPTLNTEIEKTKAQKLLFKKTKGKEISTTQEKLKLKAFLLRRGFALSIVNDLLK